MKSLNFAALYLEFSKGGENDLYARVYCRILSKDVIKKELFQALIQEPSIRLEWLYLDYPI